jgi:acetyltransferase-like isoleucine patch superfamily enzyme
MKLLRRRLRKPSFVANKTNLILVGVRRNLADIKQIAKRTNYRIIGILDKYYYGNTEQVSDIPIIGDEEWLLDESNEQAQCWKKQYCFFMSSWWDGRQHTPHTIGLDNEQVRKDRIDILERSGVNVISLIHPFADIRDEKVTIGKGVLVNAYVGISDNVTIGDYSVLDHQSRLTAFTTVGRNCIVGGGSSTGNCILEDNVRIGVNCTVVSTKKDFSALSIGQGSVIHIASVVTDDVPPGYIYTRHERMLRRFSQ